MGFILKIDFILLRGIPRIKINIIHMNSTGIRYYTSIVLPCRLSSIYRQFKLLINRQGEPEKGLLKALSPSLINQDDKLLGVGLGYGISLIHNLKNNLMHLTYIEASKTQIELAKLNLELNSSKTSGDITILEGYVGAEIGVYNSETSEYKKIDIDRIDFDVLELDCQGAEFLILSTMKSRPRVIVAELHPNLIEVDWQSLINKLKDDYFIHSVILTNGEEISSELLLDYMKRDITVGEYLNPIVTFLNNKILL